MNKTIIVCEGIHDKEKILKVRPDVDCVYVGGSAMTPESLDYLKSQKECTIYLLLDPDHPGERIRSRLHEGLHEEFGEHVIDIFVPKDISHSHNHKKIGVEHIDVDKLSYILKDLPQNNALGSLTITDLYHLGLSGQVDSKAKREQVCKVYHLYPCNTKMLLERLNHLNVSREELETLLNK